MRKVVFLLDSNIIINLFHVYQDIPEILSLLKRLKETLNLDFVLTTEVIEEIGGEKYPKQKEFLKER